MTMSKTRATQFACFVVFLIGISIIYFSADKKILVKVRFKNNIKNGTLSTSSHEKHGIKAPNRKVYKEHLVTTPTIMTTPTNHVDQTRPVTLSTSSHEKHGIKALNRKVYKEHLVTTAYD